MLSGDEFVRLLVSLGVLLAVARILGELARRVRQPAVLGELLTGILLGPSVLGRVSPSAFASAFPSEGTAAIVLDGIASLALVLFLFVAGLEVDLSRALRRLRVTALIGSAGMAVPFALGLGAALAAPGLVGGAGSAQPTLFAMFFAAALSISALPVIARTLMDLHLYRSDFGMTVVSAAMVNDLVGWIVFAVLVGQIEGAGPGHGIGLWTGIGLALAFTLVALTVLRRMLDRALPWVLAHTSWPAGIVGAAVALALLGAAVTELAGVHAVFGAFLVGVAFGDSRHLREHTRATISGFVGSVFAPLFFATIGLRIDFSSHFELSTCTVVLALACAGKLAGCRIGAALAGLKAREAWAFGFAMNARGSMEIVFGLLALRAGLIGEPAFVALVVMALGTTMLSGPALRLLLRPPAPIDWLAHADARSFVPRMRARTRREAVEELAATLQPRTGLHRERLTALVWERERTMPTGLGRGLAIPHARIDGLERPALAIGLSEAGIDFDAVDGAPARIVVLLLTPGGENARHLELLAELGRAFLDDALRTRVTEARTFTELLAAVRAERDPAPPNPFV